MSNQDAKLAGRYLGELFLAKTIATPEQALRDVLDTMPATYKPEPHRQAIERARRVLGE